MERNLCKPRLHTKIRIAYFYTGLTSLEEPKPTSYGESKLKWRMQTVCFTEYRHKINISLNGFGDNKGVHFSFTRGFRIFPRPKRSELVYYSRVLSPKPFNGLFIISPCLKRYGIRQQVRIKPYCDEIWVSLHCKDRQVVTLSILFISAIF